MLPNVLQATIEKIYADNSFMKLCGLKISNRELGEAKVALVLDDKLHTNTNHKVHSGLLMTMMDTATGLAGCTSGYKAPISYASTYLSASICCI